jgi:thymidylate synthase
VEIPGKNELFNNTISNNVIVMGSKTFLSNTEFFIKLESPTVRIVLTRSRNDVKFDPYQNIDGILFMNYDDVISYTKYNEEVKIIIIGGETTFRAFKDTIQVIHMLEVNHTQPFFTPDAFFFKIPSEFEISEYTPLKTKDTVSSNVSYRFITYKRKDKETDTHDTDLKIPYKSEYSNNTDIEYSRICKKILDQGEDRHDRTGTGTISIFGEQMRFDLSKGEIPALTTKRVPWKSCIEELLWFVKGCTNSKKLHEKGVKIWDGNSSRKFLDKVGLDHLDEGDCGANYSFQWRHFGADYKNHDVDYSSDGVNQIEYIENLMKNDPSSRRMYLSAWNPCDLNKTVLPPCHVSCQFYVDNSNRLSCHMYQRSCDMFLGVPWNILSYSILTTLFAKRNGFGLGHLVISTGDTHIYNDHIHLVKQQLVREPLCAAVLKVDDCVIAKQWDDITIDDFEMIGYFPHPSIQGKMSV